MLACQEQGQVRGQGMTRDTSQQRTEECEVQPNIVPERKAQG